MIRDIQFSGAIRNSIDIDATIAVDGDHRNVLKISRRRSVAAIAPTAGGNPLRQRLSADSKNLAGWVNHWGHLAAGRFFDCPGIARADPNSYLCVVGGKMRRDHRACCDTQIVFRQMRYIRNDIFHIVQFLTSFGICLRWKLGYYLLIE